MAMMVNTMNYLFMGGDETLLEEKRRLKDEERIRGSHIEQQRILYEKLKKKFGD